MSELGVIVHTSEFEIRETTVVRTVTASERVGDITNGAAGESTATVGEEDAIIREREAAHSWGRRCYDQRKRRMS